jgi:ADP-ribose pyrophosphatase YjhB (NUDIX family)
VVESVPVVCVDIVPRFHQDPDRPYLLIERAETAGQRGWCWVGGRVWLDERLGDAAARHLRETLGPDISLLTPDWSAPHLVVDFHRDAAYEGPRDPRKHAISMAWVVDCEGEPHPAGEARALGRFPAAELPADGEFAFGLGPWIRRLVAGDAARRSALP